MNYSVITLFKNITPTFFTFRNFYRNVWNVNEFIYIIGYNDNLNYEFIKNNYINYLGDSITINHKIKLNYHFCKNIEIIIVNNNNVNNIFLLYKTSNCCNMNDWNNIKLIMYKIILNNYVDVTKRKYISVDDDEFLYSSNMKKLKQKISNNNFHRFHFNEIVCEKKNNIRVMNSLNWSFQSWFTHRMNDSEIKYNCGACKTYFFNPSIFKNNNMNQGFWMHSNENYYNGSCCELFNNTKQKDVSLLELMKEEGICYHFTSFTYSYLKYIKLKNRYINKTNNAGNYKDLEKQYYDVYNHYDIINDNTLIEYFDEKDIRIYETLISNKL